MKIVDRSPDGARTGGALQRSFRRIPCIVPLPARRSGPRRGTALAVCEQREAIIDPLRLVWETYRTPARFTSAAASPCYRRKPDGQPRDDFCAHGRFVEARRRSSRPKRRQSTADQDFVPWRRIRPGCRRSAIRHRHRAGGFRRFRTRRMVLGAPTTCTAKRCRAGRGQVGYPAKELHQSGAKLVVTTSDPSAVKR